MKDRLIAIIGPTAVGKTKVSIDLAKKLHTEIISGDSMLLYRGMDVGTAKPDSAERDGIVHHLVDILEPHAEFSVVDFQTKAGELITQINNTGKIPILAGGTGLYVKALLEGYKFNPVTGSEAFRNNLAALAEKHGNTYVHNLLAKASPETAARLHPNDLRRIIRALEVHQFSGETVSQDKQGGEQLLYDAVVIGLTMPRAKLYERINERVDSMFANGLLEEVSRLLAAGVPPQAQAMQGIGYKEVAAYLSGAGDLPTTITNIKKTTRHFAKRQLTWFRKMPYIEWIDVGNFGNYNEMLAFIYNNIAGKFNLE